MTKFKVLLAAIIILASRTESEETMQEISEKAEKAKWKRSGMSGYIYCSACLFIPQLGEQSKVCPNCKKEMESEDENEQNKKLRGLQMA